MHRFKVKTLQKLLIHINILLAFSVLFCSHSAFGQQSAQSDTLYIVDVFVDDKAVDLGLNDVYWAKRNVGASSLSGYGNHFTWYAASNWSDSDWQHWRTPTKQEFTDLTTYTNVSVNNYICTFVNSNDPTISIILPPAGYKNPGKNKIVSQGVMGYYWASDSPPKILDPLGRYGYRFEFWINNWDLDYWNKDYQCSIRPVIDKFTITLKTSDGNTTITKSYPRGSKIQIGAYRDNCHKVASWTESKSSYSKPKTITDINGDNGYKEIIIEEDVTYTANFSIKTTDVKATTEDNRKGTVGLSIGNENN